MKHPALLALALAMLAAPAIAQTATLTCTANGPNGSTDSWNNAANWTSGIPAGTVAAVIGAGLVARVDNDTTPTHSGGLLLSGTSPTRSTSPPARSKVTPASPSPKSPMTSTGNPG